MQLKKHGKAIGALCLVFISLFGHAQSARHRITVDNGPKPELLRQQWVDSIYNKLTYEERIGQLFMVAAYSGGKLYNEDTVTKLIAGHQVGGLIFMQGGPVRQANLTNKYQMMAQVPLLISMDAEWGLGMRLDSVQNFPRQMMLGAARDTGIVRRMGMAIAMQCKRLGVHIDFAPDVDVNNNPDNPVINSRSFGEDKLWVTKLGIAYMRGLQDNGVMACAKHFPGHGNTATDSHKDLPQIDRTLQQLDTLELYPFKELIKAGVKSVMIAHLAIPALETEPHVPTTLSRNTVTGLLKEKMGFKGLVFTDALDMKGVAKYFAPGDVDLRAFMAGNDVLLFSQDVPMAISKIKTAIDSSKIPMSQLETSVKKILAAKYDAGLAHWQPVSTDNITNDLNQYIVPIRQLATKAAATVKDENGVLAKINPNMRVSYIGINAAGSTPLYEELYDNMYMLKKNWLPKGAGADSVNRILQRMQDNDANIVAVHSLSFYPGNSYSLDAQQLSFLQQAATMRNVVVVVLGNPYAMQNFGEPRSMVVTYEDDTIAEHVAAQVLMKKMKAKGKLPVTPAYKVFPPYTPPAEVIAATEAASPDVLRKVMLTRDAGVVDENALYKLNLFLQRCVVDGAFPGCRVVAAKDGKVFYDKSFGYLSYDKMQMVDSNTIYDVASCTKVLSTTLCVMRLYEQGKLNLDKTIGDYLPWVKGTNKAGLKVKDLLLHQAGLKAIIPFTKSVIDSRDSLRNDLFRHVAGQGFDIPVARDLYLRHDYRDTMWQQILNSSLDNKGHFVYSDLDFYFLAAIVEQVTGQHIDKYVDEQFYKPMGLKRITYLPLNKFSADEIAPTEIDLFFRHQTLRGYVHDPGAALFGGVEGHAGIFASADDVAAIFQMLLNKGHYKGKRLFKPETVEYFTAYNTRLSRRGLGFDKPLVDKDDGGPAGDRCSGYTFGHQGFTGTCAWADPATGVVFVFLSNRVNPSADNTKINHLNIRTVAQDYIYEALGFPINHDRPEVYQVQLDIKRK